MSPWTPGFQLGPYELITPIGAGGMGEIWKARDARLNRVVAVKRLKETHGSRFEQEARAIAALNHPYICQIYDVGVDYLVLEYIEGKPLEGPLEIREAIRLCLQVIAALEAAHHRGVIHRDLKPANILVTSEGSAKLLDFGLAKQIENSDQTQTIEGTVIGTVAYMSPEQAAGRPLDIRTDIFSFGAVLYELLSGRRPFEGHNAISVLAAVIHKDPQFLETSPELLQIVNRCLAKRPEDRFQTVHDLKHALESVRDGSFAVASKPSIAVLPFTNLSPDKENAYFSDGLSEEIINALAQVPGLKVIARTSAFAFRGKEMDIRRVAETLGVAHLLEGSVRRAGNRIRITAQLIAASDGSHLWSQRYDREVEDVFAVQDDVSAAIARTLQAKLAGSTPAPKRYIPKLAAYEAYLKARFHQWHFAPESVVQAKQYYEQSIALDPNFALAHVGYADYIFFMTFFGNLPINQGAAMVRAEAQRALEIEPGLPEAYAMLGFIAANHDYDWKEADRLFELAMAMKPIPPLVHAWYGLYLMKAGRAEEAVAQCDLSLREDPLNPSYKMGRAISLMWADRYAEAEQEARHVLEIHPQGFPMYGLLVSLLAARGMNQEAMVYAKKMYPRIAWSIGGLAAMRHRLGDVAEAERLMQEFPAEDSYAGPMTRVVYYMMRSNMEETVFWLEKIIEQRHPSVWHVLAMPFGREIRKGPHWSKLARMLNLQ